MSAISNRNVSTHFSAQLYDLVIVNIVLKWDNAPIIALSCTYLWSFGWQNLPDIYYENMYIYDGLDQVVLKQKSYAIEIFWKDKIW